MAAASPYRALPPQVWRQLLAQSVLLQAVADRLGDLHDASLAGGAAHAAVTQLPLACQAAAAGAASDQAAVSEGSRLWCDALDQLLALAPADPHIALLRSVRADLPAAVPYDHFARLFASVASLAADVYRHSWIPPQLELSWTSAHPSGGSDPYPLTARTLSNPAPVVELEIHPSGLLPAAYSALPYLLVHEVVCHVAARPLGQSDNRSPFAEGFMDWAAQFFLEPWMTEIDVQLSATALEHARLLDLTVTRPATREGAARRLGRRAAAKLVVWLSRKPGWTHSMAGPRAARFALDLNCVDASLALKDRFVVALNGPLAAELEARLWDVVERRASPESVL